MIRATLLIFFLLRGKFALYASGVAPTSYWLSTSVPSSISGAAPKLLTDGSVLIFASSFSSSPGGGYFWKLTPDIYGSYVGGTWTKTSSITGNYDPAYFASAVLPDGRVVIAGGEYGTVSGGANAALYDPVIDKWLIIEPPSYCTNIGDSSSIVLADGRWLVAFAWCNGGAVLNYKNVVVSSLIPTATPIKRPTVGPTVKPSVFPTREPTTKPTTNPSSSPTKNPTRIPTTKPTTRIPTTKPTIFPTEFPTAKPTSFPTVTPTKSPTVNPSTYPTSSKPTANPTNLPTFTPTTPTLDPTTFPSVSPTTNPTTKPTTMIPTFRPTSIPTYRPSTLTPTSKPTTTPTVSPTKRPTLSPSVSPTKRPTVIPTIRPSVLPTSKPSSSQPSTRPSVNPTVSPSKRPTTSPSTTPLVTRRLAATSSAALINGTLMTWTKLQYTGKVDGNDEAGLTLLPDNTILTVLYHAEIYDPDLDKWTSAGTLPVSLVNELGEIGPQVLRPDGTVFIAGATGATVIYNTKTKTFTQGPSFPTSPLGNRCTLSDSPAALLPNGNVLVVCSGGTYSYGSYQSGPSYWYEFDGTSLHLQASPSDGGGSSYYYNMLVLPTGQILQVGLSSQVDFYNPANTTYPDSWRPVITSLPSTICLGATSLQIGGIRLNGMSQGASYGDDSQSDTNYSLVRITNTLSKHVFYCRTHDHSSMSVQSPLTAYTYFDVPTTVELGTSVLEVVASGIASLPSPITVLSSC